MVLTNQNICAILKIAPSPRSLTSHPTALGRPRSAVCGQPFTARCLLPCAFCPLLFAFCLLPCPLVSLSALAHWLIGSLPFACLLLVSCLCPDIAKSPQLPSDGQARLRIFSAFAYPTHQKASITETSTSIVPEFFPFCLPYPKEEFALRWVARHPQNVKPARPFLLLLPFAF